VSTLICYWVAVEEFARTMLGKPDEGDGDKAGDAILVAGPPYDAVVPIY
jgi:hypothetical protein